MRSKNSYRAGLFAEWYARMFLRLHGYQIVDTRWVSGRYTGRAEIDIIAKRGNYLVFIEVKNRPDAEAGYFAVTAAQRQRLRLAAENYIARKRWRGFSRFDIIVVSGARVRWMKNVIL